MNSEILLLRGGYLLLKNTATKEQICSPHNLACLCPSSCQLMESVPDDLTSSAMLIGEKQSSDQVASTFTH